MIIICFLEIIILILHNKILISKCTKNMEQKRRSILKAVTWRMTGTVDTIVISFLLTGKMTTALSIGGIEVFTKMLLYYAHERIWNKVKFGKILPHKQVYNDYGSEI